MTMIYEIFRLETSVSPFTSMSDFTNASTGTIIVKNNGDRFIKNSKGAWDVANEIFKISSGIDSGSTNAYAVNLAPAPTAYVAGAIITIRNILNTPTGPSTVNINGLGNIPLKINGLDLTGSEFSAGDDIQFQINNARTEANLTFATHNPFSTPPGFVAHFASTSPPPGWIAANGAAISRSTYAALFNAIGTTWGTGDGSTTFNIPDYRGYFIRGYDNGAGVDPGRVFGSIQGDEFASHTHPLSRESGDNTTAANIYYNLSNNNSAGQDYTKASGGSETRPKNQTGFACIKY